MRDTRGNHKSVFWESTVPGGTSTVPADCPQGLSGDIPGNFKDVEIEPAMIPHMTALILAFGLLHAFLSAIQYISIVYSGASFLTNETVVLADAASAVGRLWKPVILTSLSLFAATSGLFAAGVAVMYAFYLRSNDASILQEGHALITLVVAFIRFAFQVGLVVPVLEGVSGWKALGRSWKLLQGKKCMALWMIIILRLLVLVLEFLLVIVFEMVLKLFDISALSYVVNFVLYLVISSLDVLLVKGTQTFLYFSCKALHQESITDSAFFQAQVRNRGYERIAQHLESYDVESSNTPGS